MSEIRLHIAVVDDDDSLSQLMRLAGAQVDTFVSGEALLARLSVRPSYRPDCVILDIWKTGINGLDLHRRLAGSGLPVVVMTTRARHEGDP